MKNKNSNLKAEKTSIKHKRSLAKVRRIIDILIAKLEKSIDDKSIIKELPEHWGEKENVVSILTKLTSLLVKVIPLEREFDDSDVEVRPKISAEDKEIIRRYFERLQRKKTNYKAGLDSSDKY